MCIGPCDYYVPVASEPRTQGAAEADAAAVAGGPFSGSPRAAESGTYLSRIVYYKYIVCMHIYIYHMYM